MDSEICKQGAIDMICVMKRKKSKVETCEASASIPNNISMLSVFGTNGFVNKGDYREDGWVYVNKKPVKKWFRKVANILIWFPILNDVHKLQERYRKASQKYKDYMLKYHFAYEQIEKVGKAHTNVVSDNDDRWWLYTSEKQWGISWEWVEPPKKPINLEIGNTYYKVYHRLHQIIKRANMFQTVLEYAIEIKVNAIQGKENQILQCKVGDSIYWFKKGRHVWEKLAFPEDEIKVFEIDKIS